MSFSFQHADFSQTEHVYFVQTGSVSLLTLSKGYTVTSWHLRSLCRQPANLPGNDMVTRGKHATTVSILCPYVPYKYELNPAGWMKYGSISSAQKSSRSLKLHSHKQPLIIQRDSWRVGAKKTNSFTQRLIDRDSIYFHCMRHSTWMTVSFYCLFDSNLNHTGIKIILSVSVSVSQSFLSLWSLYHHGNTVTTCWHISNSFNRILTCLCKQCLCLSFNPPTTGADSLNE